jgi:phage terminase large subunit-like protein
VAKRAADARDVMIEGDSGILSVCPPDNRPIYEPSKRRLTWPNGAIATAFSDEEPEDLRGPQHEKAWVDELSKFQNAEDTWDHLEFGLRLGDNPQAVVTTTPQPTKVYKRLLTDPLTVVTRASTYANAANLAPSFIERIRAKYEGTRLGRQEIHAELVEDYEGALWTNSLLDLGRRRAVPDGVSLARVAVAIDPSTTSMEESAETGIVVAGLGSDRHGYVLADLSLRGTPIEWATRAIVGYEHFHADVIIGEANNGGDMIEAVIRAACLRRKRSENIPYRKVHASRGKATRAEPVSMLYEQGLVHHVGTLPDLETQMTTWVPGMTSPDRMDALVWAVTFLMLDSRPSGRAVAGGERPRRGL